MNRLFLCSRFRRWYSVRLPPDAYRMCLATVPLIWTPSAEQLVTLAAEELNLVHRVISAAPEPSSTRPVFYRFVISMSAIMTATIANPTTTPTANCANQLCIVLLSERETGFEPVPPTWKDGMLIR